MSSGFGRLPFGIESQVSAPIEESYEALTWVSGQNPNRWNCNPNAIVVAGDSDGGGSLAAVIAHVVREGGGRAKGRALCNNAGSLRAWGATTKGAGHGTRVFICAVFNGPTRYAASNPEFLQTLAIWPNLGKSV